MIAKNIKRLLIFIMALFVTGFMVPISAAQAGRDNLQDVVISVPAVKASSGSEYEPDLEQIRINLNGKNLEKDNNIYWGLHLDESYNGKEITVYEGQSFDLSLNSNPSTGYVWDYVNPRDDKILQEIDASYQADIKAENIVGSGGKNSWIFKAVYPGTTEIEMSYKRPWENIGEEDTFKLKINVQVQTLRPLDAELAYEKVLEAIKEYNFLAAGGYEAQENFEYDYKKYRYLKIDENIHDKWELQQYLHRVYTYSAAEKVINELGIFEHEGQLAQPDADGGSLLDWERAQVSLVSDGEYTKQFRFKVPCGNDIMTYLIDFKLDKSDSWLLDSLPDENTHIYGVNMKV